MTLSVSQFTFRSCRFLMPNLSWRRLMGWARMGPFEIVWRQLRYENASDESLPGNSGVGYIVVRSLFYDIVFCGVNGVTSITSKRTTNTTSLPCAKVASLVDRQQPDLWAMQHVTAVSQFMSEFQRGWNCGRPTVRRLWFNFDVGPVVSKLWAEIVIHQQLRDDQRVFQRASKIFSAANLGTRRGWNGTS